MPAAPSPSRERTLSLPSMAPSLRCRPAPVSSSVTVSCSSQSRLLSTSTGGAAAAGPAATGAEAGWSGGPDVAPVSGLDSSNPGAHGSPHPTKDTAISQPQPSWLPLEAARMVAPVGHGCHLSSNGGGATPPDHTHNHARTPEHLRELQSVGVHRLRCERDALRRATGGVAHHGRRPPHHHDGGEARRAQPREQAQPDEVPDVQAACARARACIKSFYRLAPSSTPPPPRTKREAS